MMFELKCYRLGDYAVPLEPAQPERDIFEANRHAYRCLPLAVANTAGWVLLCPSGVTIDWNGGPGVGDLTVTLDEPGLHQFAKSHFATGIVTFEVGWLFRTTPGYHLWAMGPTNNPKDGISPLSGLIETDWLPYTFTMNWKMTRPGQVRFEKGEPFCFITPAQIGAVADCRPTAMNIADDAQLQADLLAWSTERGELMKSLAAGDLEAAKTPWGRRYFKGQHAEGATADAPIRHFHKLRAKNVAWTGLPGELGEDGRLRASATTRVVTCAADAAGLGFLVVDDLLSAEACDQLAAAYATSAPLYEEHHTEEFWNDRLLGYQDLLMVNPAAAAQMSQALDQAVREARHFYGPKVPLYPDVLHLVGWKTGQHMPIHADNAYQDGRPHALAHRDYSGLLYLTDDYEGGGLYLHRQDILIRPNKGTFVSLPAGLTHEHGVQRVEKGQRTTMAFFLTKDKTRQIQPLG